MAGETMEVTLRTLLESLGEAHEEMDDSEVREQMFAAVARTFLNPTPGFALPTDFGLSDARANAAVRAALQTYIDTMSVAATHLGLDTPEQRSPLSRTRT
jgi:hypothetical protein